MNRSFPLFQSHLDFAHSFWDLHLKPGDWALDATCGNGKDFFKLSQLVTPKGGVIGLDIQESALNKTRALFTEGNSPLHLFQMSHATFPPIAYTHPLRLIVYNLGYLPGGDKGVTTLSSTTLMSLEVALKILPPGGVISLMCYPGHSEGEVEYRALNAVLETLSPSQWSISSHSWINRQNSPALLLIQKNLN